VFGSFRPRPTALTVTIAGRALNYRTDDPGSAGVSPVPRSR